MKKSLVVIPTYNEAENIEPLLRQILALPSRFDVLVIDDASPDQTLAHVLKIQKNEGKDRVFTLSRSSKQGLGSAYVMGFDWALQKPYDFILQMDADLSHDPHDLERLLDATETADLVLGTRYIEGGSIEGWPLHRLLLSRFANIYARLVTGLPFHDLTGGFKCYRRAALGCLDLDTIRSQGYAFQIETSTRVARKGFRIREIPILFRERVLGVSKISRAVIFEAFFIVAKLGLARFFHPKSL